MSSASAVVLGGCDELPGSFGNHAFVVFALGFHFLHKNRFMRMFETV
jgi:hypothetical protein